MGRDRGVRGEVRGGESLLQKPHLDIGKQKESNWNDFNKFGATVRILLLLIGYIENKRFDIY